MLDPILKSRIAKPGGLEGSGLFLKEISGKVIRTRIEKWLYQLGGSLWVSASKSAKQLL
jgi:hypothetical protein